MRIRGERPEIALVNGNVLTLDTPHPRADAVLVKRGRIVWVGESRKLSREVLAAADTINCDGQTVIPGFIDAHCHLLAYAASLTAVDCSPDAVSSVDDILREIGRRAEVTPRGEWIRAAGYSEFGLYEKHHPTRWDLDRAVPYHPVRLNHRSGHASVLNSVALERVGITNASEEPPGGTIVRDLSNGEPNGLLLEMDDWLDECIPHIEESQLDDAIGLASRKFLSQGITSVTDATASNDIGRWNTLTRLATDGRFEPNLSVMLGVSHLDDFQSAGIGFGNGNESCRLGHAKIMLTRSGGKLHPQPEALSSIIASAHALGFPVAIHAVESEAVIAAAEALAANRKTGLRDRIEHVSECPPDALEALLHANPVVVSQPRLILDNGARYLSELGADARWLYRFATLIESGMILAASSDAPVSRPSPLLSMHAAVARQTLNGELVGESEGLTAAQALEMHTKNAAFAICSEGDIGSIAPGKKADIVILSDDPTTITPECLLEVQTTMTILGGRVAWAA